MNVLNFEPEEIKANIRADQAKKLESIKFEGRMKKDLKLSKAGIVREALDQFFENRTVDDILNYFESKMHQSL